jgi:AraC-like DNA-binding protein
MAPSCLLHGAEVAGKGSCMADAFTVLLDRLLPLGRGWQDRHFVTWDPADGTTPWLSSSLVVQRHWLDQQDVSVPRLAVVWLLRGSGAIRWGRGPWHAIAAGAGFLRFPKVRHTVRIDPMQPVAFWSATLPPGAADLLLSLGLTTPTQALLPCCRDPELLRRAGELHAALRRREDLPRAQIELVALVQELLRHRRQLDAEAVLAQALADATDHRSLAQIAAALGLSASRLRHRFAARHGLAPEAWRRRERLRRAHRLLAAGGLTAEAVARQCGWSGVRAMAKAFRVAFGYPPSACRVVAD